MKKSKQRYFLGFGAISLLAATLLLWMLMLPAGAAPGSAPDAAPSGQVTGTIDVSPTVVSPSNTVGTGQRLVAITLTDADLNRPRFIGSGPNGETPSTAGARFILPTDTQQGGPGGGSVGLRSGVRCGSG